MTITASASRACALIASTRFLTEAATLDAIQAAIDEELAPLAAEIASLKAHINKQNDEAQAAQMKFNEQLTATAAALKAALAAKPAPTDG